MGFLGKAALRNASTLVQDVIMSMVCANMDAFLDGKDTSATKVLLIIYISERELFRLALTALVIVFGMTYVFDATK